jgi:hypothetical protein
LDRGAADGIGAHTVYRRWTNDVNVCMPSSYFVITLTMSKMRVGRGGRWLLEIYDAVRGVDVMALGMSVFVSWFEYERRVDEIARGSYIPYWIPSAISPVGSS